MAAAWKRETARMVVGRSRLKKLEASVTSRSVRGACQPPK